MPFISKNLVSRATYKIAIAIFLFIALFGISQKEVFAQISPTPLWDLNDSEYFTISTDTWNPINLTLYSGFTDDSNTKILTIGRGDWPNTDDLIANNGNTTVSWTTTAGWNPTHIYADLFYCPTTDDYWALIQDSSGGNLYTTWSCVNTTGNQGIITPGTPPPTDFTTRIDSLTYSTSTQEVNITGYMNVATTTYNQLEFYQNTTGLGDENFNYLSATSSGAFDITYTYDDLPTASTTSAQFLQTITLYANIYNVDPEEYDPFGSGDGFKTLLVSTSTSFTENENDLFDPLTAGGIYSVPDYECSLTQMTGCLKNAGVWLFYPSQSSLSGFSQIPNQLSNKAPFIYVYQTKDLLQGLFTEETGSNATTSISYDFAGLGTLTLISKDMVSSVPFSSWIKTVLSALIWFMFSITIYRRTMKIHDSNTQTI